MYLPYVNLEYDWSLPTVVYYQWKCKESRVRVAQFVFLFLARAIYRESPAKIDVKTDNIMVKNKSTITFHGLYSSRPYKWSQNVQNFPMKPFACGLWFHMSFEHFDIISMVHIRVQRHRKFLAFRTVNYLKSHGAHNECKPASGINQSFTGMARHKFIN